jgi:hypothetical protein
VKLKQASSRLTSAQGSGSGYYTLRAPRLIMTADRPNRQPARTSTSSKELRMTTRRNVFVGAPALAAILATSNSTLAQNTSDPSKTGDFLFVQTAKGMSFDRAGGKLTLESVSPVTLFFTDRPERIAGNMKTTSFLPFWSEGKDSFLSDPPNADVSILEGEQLRQVVVVLRDPVLQGDSLIYTVKVLQGEMPAKAADVSVFIDIIGMPLTPVSYAGVARRSYRRAFYYR